MRRSIDVDVYATEVMNCYRPGLEAEMDELLEELPPGGFGPPGELNGFFNAYRDGLIMWYLDCPGRYTTGKQNLQMLLEAKHGQKMGFGPGFTPISEDTEASETGADEASFLQEGREEYMVGLLQRLLSLHTPEGNVCQVPPLEVPGAPRPYQLTVPRLAEAGKAGEEAGEQDPPRVLMVIGADHADSFRNKWAQYEEADRVVPDERMQHLIQTAGGYDAWYIRDINMLSEESCVMPPGHVFTKRWEFKNPFPLQWPEGTQLMYNKGDNALTGGHRFFPVTQRAGYREFIEVPVELTAPDVPGTYIAEFSLVSANFVKFGEAMWLKVEVKEDAPQPPEALAGPRPTNLSRYHR